MKRTPLMLMVFLLLAFPIASLAQSTDEGEQSDQKVRILPPAYDPQMLRLAEILGALHYLRDLCGADEGQKWRNQMQQILETENPIPDRRANLIAHFNRGFRGFQETYRECTDAAVEANNRYLFEGAKLAGEIPGRFGR